MKKFTAKFFRSNPQLKSGGYETTREIEARTLNSAKIKAEKICKNTKYGSMELLSISESVQ